MAVKKKWLKGQLLLDGGQLTGSFFHRTVVLVCQHDAEGAFGLVLNRASGGTLGELVTDDLPDALQEESVFVGGPVQPAAFSYLHTDHYLPEANVMPNVGLGHSLENLVDLASGFASGWKVRLFAGYSGWAPGQLESELKRKAWVTHPGSVDLVFHTPAEELWQTILRGKGWQHRLLSQAPEDPAWN